ncbi:MAG: hypothetical protein M1570_10625 [Chloroflexi bacterium]|nr:hypothetical protein [Chloroflexota bacterium]
MRTRPLFGRWIALDLRSTRPLTFIGPAWAALCGAIASGGLAFRGQNILFLVLSLLLCDAVLGGWRVLWAESEWRRLLHRRAAAEQEVFDWVSDPSDPRLVNIAHWILRQIVRGGALIRLFVNSDFVPIATAGILALSIAAVLGSVTMALVVAAMILALVERELRLDWAAWLRAFGEITLSWFIAQSALGVFSWPSLVIALLFTLVYRALLSLVTGRNGRWILVSNLAQVAVVLFLIAGDTALGAGIALLGLLAQILWQARYHQDHDGAFYARQVQSYVLVVMAVSALALWF